MSHTSFSGEQQRSFLEHSVVIRILQPIEPFAVIGSDEKVAMGVKQASAFLQGILDDLNVLDALGAECET